MKNSMLRISAIMCCVSIFFDSLALKAEPVASIECQTNDGTLKLSYSSVSEKGLIKINSKKKNASEELPLMAKIFITPDQTKAFLGTVSLFEKTDKEIEAQMLDTAMIDLGMNDKKMTVHAVRLRKNVGESKILIFDANKCNYLTEDVTFPSKSLESL